MDLDALDRTLAEKVMGWHYRQDREAPGAEPGVWVDSEGEEQVTASRWRPTRDGNHALLLVRNVYSLGVYSASQPPGVYHADCGQVFLDGEKPRYERWDATAGTPELAICLAAAKKYGIEVT